ncbi:MAG: caspase family protein, partial [Planctomycetaceae bacterium]|nr:caspase family protein [Planctomycetaceae bacterium]
MSHLLAIDCCQVEVPLVPHVPMIRTLFATKTILLLLTAVAFSNESQSGNKYAIIIAVSQYDNEQFSLPLVANDASALANTLHQRGGFEIIPLYESFDPNVPTSPRTVPTKGNILTEVSRVLENCKQDDTVFLYFSGHGYPDRQDPNKTYLLPKDVDVKKIPDTLLETAWLRDLLARCKATTKFLVIDACHAGGEKSVNLDPDSDLQTSKSLSSHELIGGGVTGVVTLASSTKNQLSYFWEEKGMSLFSYWLNEGLKGHADLNGDGMITFNELDEYVVKNVSKTAKEIKNVTQTPVRIIGSAVPGVPVVITPHAVSLNVLLDDIAEQIAAAMRLHNVKRTGVLEFSMEQGGRALGRTNNGALGAYCAEQLEELIKYRLPRRDGFRIVTRESVEKALASKGIGPNDLFDSTISEKNITFNDQPLESYVVGIIESQRGSEIKFRCILVSVDNIERLHTARGTAILTESEWGMLGRSIVISAEVPAGAINAVSVRAVSENVTVVDPDKFLPSLPGDNVPVRVATKPVSIQLV